MFLPIFTIIQFSFIFQYQFLIQIIGQFNNFYAQLLIIDKIILPNKPILLNLQLKKMQEQHHQQQKKFQIKQEWHRQKPNTKIYKLRINLTNIMIKAQQKLKAKFDIQQYTPSNSNNINRSSNNQPEDETTFHASLYQDDNKKQTYSSANNSNQSKTPFSQNVQKPQKPVKIYEDFANRGKFDVLKYFYSKQKQRLTILISQDYFINELKCKQFDLLLIYPYFTKSWTDQFLQIMQAFMKYSKQFKNHQIIKFQFIAIDILGVTFDVAYHNKADKQQLKRFRFRYSIFQFRQNPFFEQKNSQQTIAFVQINSNNAFSMTHDDFYSSMRLGFIDDINNNNNDLWKRVIMRFWVFYQLHCLYRGVGDFQEFNKKALGRCHFHSIRMKKFQLIFPFPLLSRCIIDQKKQGTLTFTFYLDQKDITMSQTALQFKMLVNLVQHHSIISHEQKQQLYYRLKKQELFQLTQLSNPPRHNELFEFFIKLKFDDKISRAFAKFSAVVSFFVDKICFNQLHGRGNNQRQISAEQAQNQKIIQIYAPKRQVYEQSNFRHTHVLILQLRHKYWVPNHLQFNIKYLDQIQFVKLSKKKWKMKLKDKKQQLTQKSQIFINQDLKKYIKHLLKIKPLRECYIEIMQYIEKVIKIIYCPFKQNNNLTKYDNRQLGLTMIITNIMKFLDLQNHTLRRSDIMIITQDSPLFMKQEKQHDLIAQVTFNIKDLKIYWIKRLPEGYIILRLFQDRIEVLKDLSGKVSLKINYANIDKNPISVEKNYFNGVEKVPLTGLQKINNDLMMELKNILLKQFATLQNMMV